jgi:ABC-type uncharacterized transport system substrate-binding protein
MPSWAKNLIVTALGPLAWVMLSSGPAAAHPHAWIDLKDVVLFNDEGAVAGLRVRWKFDEFYTLYAIEEFDKDGDGKPDDDQLWKLAVVNLDSLAEYDYFTYMKVDGVQPAYAKVTEYDTFMEDERLVLIFTVKLLVPADPRHHTVSYAVYDPTYYIEIAHVPQSEDPISFEGPAPQGCSYKLQLPNPDEDLSLFAASLDKTQSSSDGLGAAFAEQVLIQCK